MNDEAADQLGNADQIAYWNSENGKKWVLHQEGLDTLLSKVKERLLARAAPRKQDSVIDIGCGTGDTTMATAMAIGESGFIRGVDISSLLLNLAKKRAEAVGLQNIEFALADAQTHSFEPEAADLVISRFGVMFFSDPVKAFANIARALKSSGRVVFVSWASLDENPWFSVPRQRAIERLGNPAPSDPDAPGPLAFRDKDFVLGILCAAGYSDAVAESEDVPLPFFGSLKRTAALASSVGPAARIVGELDGDEADIAAISDAVEKAFQTYAEQPSPSVPSRLNFFSAIKP